jgi:hypothetical protein
MIFYCKKANINCLLARLSFAKKHPSSNPDRAGGGGGEGI